MMRKPISGILSNLMVIAEEVIMKPAVARHSQEFRRRLSDLAGDVREADGRLQEGGPVTSSAMVMVTVLERYMVDDDHLASMWLVLAGATLPLLRAETYTSFKNEREARASNG